MYTLVSSNIPYLKITRIEVKINKKETRQSIGNLSIDCSPHFDLKSWTIDNIDIKNGQEVINYFSCKFGRDLTGSNNTRPSFDRQNVTLAEFCVQFLVTIPWPGHLVLLNSVRQTTNLSPGHTERLRQSQHQRWYLPQCLRMGMTLTLGVGCTGLNQRGSLQASTLMRSVVRP